ncbi:hypothetical protein ASG51_22235 [Methylobacterium sp. Leaf465]|nr:hypothetical protein ASG51_22235 [Methylobacterium sp. Leaf465]
MVAPEYAARRSELAKLFGLGRIADRDENEHPEGPGQQEGCLTRWPGLVFEAPQPSLARGFVIEESIWTSASRLMTGMGGRTNPLARDGWQLRGFRIETSALR